MESQPQNPEFRNNPESFHPCTPSGEQTKLKRVCPSKQSAPCSHTKSMEVEEDSVQNKYLYPH